MEVLSSNMKRRTRLPRAKFDSARIVGDMALRGWNHSDMARATGFAVTTITTFLRGRSQTPKVATAIAQALGYSVRRYFSHVEAA